MNNQIRLKRRDAMRYYTTCNWESYARVAGYRQKFIQRWIFFFTVYTGLKNLCISCSLTMYPYLPLTGKAELPQTSGLHAEHMLTQNPWKNCDSCPESIFLKLSALWTATISTLSSRPHEGMERSDGIHTQQTVAQSLDMCPGKTTFLYYYS